MLQRVLIVDDSLPLHQIIKAQLDEEGLEFHSTFDGATALTAAAAVRPGVILLDIDMPDMDGFEVCRHLKANPVTASIPVIFLTADYSSHDKVKGLDLGAIDYVTKPFKARELSARVRAALRSKQMLEEKAMVDGLTGLWSLSYFESRLAEQVASASRSGRPLSCIAVDVDGLERINQKYGALFGDEVLRSLGNYFLSQCRAADIVCRCAGGEFAILLSGMDRSSGGQLADRLCAEIREQFRTHGGIDVGVTCSFGVADSVVAASGSVLERARLTLRRAKLNGGGCVSTARAPRKDVRQAA